MQKSARKPETRGKKKCILILCFARLYNVMPNKQKIMPMNVHAEIGDPAQVLLVSLSIAF